MILIQPMLTEHLLAGTSLAMEQMDAKKSEIVFLPPQSLLHSSQCGLQTSRVSIIWGPVRNVKFRPHSRPTVSETLEVTPSPAICV